MNETPLQQWMRVYQQSRETGNPAIIPSRPKKEEFMEDDPFQGGWRKENISRPVTPITCQFCQNPSLANGVRVDGSSCWDPEKACFTCCEEHEKNDKLAGVGFEPESE